MRLAALGIAIACLICTNAMTADYRAGSIEIMSPWSRATPKGSKVAVGYMTIKNNGISPDRLIGGSIDIAANLELHSMVIENGIARMRELKDVEIGPGQTIEFKPGGSHVMFVDLRKPLSKGEHVKGTLVFEHAGTVQIEYDVGGVGAQRAP